MIGLLRPPMMPSDILGCAGGSVASSYGSHALGAKSFIHPEPPIRTIERIMQIPGTELLVERELDKNMLSLRYVTWCLGQKLSVKITEYDDTILRIHSDLREIVMERLEAGKKRIAEVIAERITPVDHEKIIQPPIQKPKRYGVDLAAYETTPIEVDVEAYDVDTEKYEVET